ALSHFASSASCVVFPDPSMPSTTKSFPGYSCGVVRLFSMRCAFLLLDASSRHFKTQRPAQDVLERLAMTMRRPQFQFGVASRLQPNHVLIALGNDVERGDDLGVAPVQPFGQAQHGGPRAARTATPHSSG